MTDTVKGVPFVTLLKLTSKGREDLDAAAKHLSTIAEQIEEVGGRCDAVMMTYGDTDAAVAGEVKDLETLMRLMANAQKNGIYVTDTHVGIRHPDIKDPRKPPVHRDRHHA
jgi:uncharacterized protein with GYD domain